MRDAARGYLPVILIASPSMRGSKSARAPSRRRLYRAIEPYRTGFLRASGLHEMYLEECGNPDGKPAIYLHGGPGGGTEPRIRRFFDPARYRIVLLDQRGCGKCRPHASLEDNTTSTPSFSTTFTASDTSPPSSCRADTMSSAP
jgi:hypothetical protein